MQRLTATEERVPTRGRFPRISAFWAAEEIALTPPLRANTSFSTRTKPSVQSKISAFYLE